MSVLKNKISSVSRRFKPSADMSIWEQLQTVLIDDLSPLTGIDLAAASVEQAHDRLKRVRAEFEGPQVVFALGYHLSPWPVLIVPDRPLCAHIAAQALKSARGAAVFEDKARYLDLLLCEPVASTVCKFLGARLPKGSSGENIHKSGQALSFDTFDLGSENADWLRLDLSFVPEKRKPKVSAKDKMEEDNQAKPENPENDSLDKISDETKADRMGLSLLWPAHLFSQLDLQSAGAAPDWSSDKLCDDFLKKVWADHMLHSIDGAAIRIRAVLDDYPMSVAECTRLEIGQVLPLDGASTQSVRLEVNTQSGPMSLADAVLGTFKTRRALKLNQAMAGRGLVLEGLLESSI